VIDLSFISLTKVMNHIVNLLAPGADVVALIKPQFEAGLERIPKDGVIKDENLRKIILEEVLAHFTSLGLVIKKVIDSPIEGKNGNHEYLAWLKKAE
jgi:23S rRNA (cytidine1920-2'-O)/16S rRNA (cytidine1409-2'-O)-methyltransferase